MRFYHTDAPATRPAQKELHPKIHFSIQGDTLRRTINDNERLLLQSPVLALAVPVAVLFDAERAGVQWVVLHAEHGRTYRAPLSAFWRKPAFEVNRGFGRQRALPLAAMTDGAAPEQPEQLGLFKEVFV
jgi:hypothetical protein